MDDGFSNISTYHTYYIKWRETDLLLICLPFSPGCNVRLNPNYIELHGNFREYSGNVPGLLGRQGGNQGRNRWKMLERPAPQ